MPFSQKSLDFLIENQFNDNKEWFNAHKSDYIDYVLQPMQELVTALAPGMLKTDPGLIVEPKIDKTISRIYRDIRFSKDKSLYRNNCWLTFMREKKLYLGLPAFWFEVNPTGFGYGMGYYHASTLSMDSVRNMIINGDILFQKAWKAFKKQIVFVLEGDMYKKTRHDGQPEELRSILDRRSISFNHHSNDLELLFSDRLAEELKCHYVLLEPMYRFLCEAETRKQSNGESK